MLFATELGLGPGEGAAAVTVQAEDASGTPYPLTVEYAGPVAGFDMATVIVRLDGPGEVGDVNVSVTVHGMTSNAVLIGIGHVGGLPDLGSGASLHGKQVLPADNPWNQDISTLPVDSNSNNLIASIGVNTTLHPDFGTVFNGAPNGIPYVVVAGTQPLVPINFTAFGNQSDPGPYPVPTNAPIEGGSRFDWGSSCDRNRSRQLEAVRNVLFVSR